MQTMREVAAEWMTRDAVQLELAKQIHELQEIEYGDKKAE
jgi:hypothetical protein